jgi:tRNA G18 (ribose-2'-O)-methylase SpoU
MRFVSKHSLMKGYFGIGVEGLSKQQNLGALMRTSHAFGAQFLFTVGANYSRRMAGKSDTSSATNNLPLYAFETLGEMVLPKDCQMVGIELTDDAIELPSFRHPAKAAYVLGPERASLSPEMTALCAHVIKIPTQFCINVGLAGALVMYDRMISMGRFAERPVRVGGPIAPLKPHVHGGPKLRHLESAAKAES